MSKSTNPIIAGGTFPFTALIVLAFGPGAFSVDYLIARWRGQEWRSARL
jgi:hypothetical protein